MSKTVLALCSVLVLASCRTTERFPEPGKITLEEAMRSVGAGLKAMEEAEGGLVTGLLASEVTVTFNVTASATDTNRLFVEVGAGAAPAVAGKAGAESGTTTTAARGNQITIRFNSMFFAGRETTLNLKQEKALKELVEMLHEKGIVKRSHRPQSPRPAGEEQEPTSPQVPPDAPAPR